MARERDDPTSGGDALSETIERNIEALIRHEQREAHEATLQDRIAERITAFAGSMPFVYLHAVLFGGWIVLNLGVVPGVAPWDPSMVILAMIASVEAIFISTFVLINQNRMTEMAERRASLNLQISLLDEHETTRLISLVSAIADRLGVETPIDDEVEELQRDVEPEAVLSRIERGQQEYTSDS
jgi:uncharacterized membrane protein